MSLKLDMSKAYDGVSWEFLEHIMLKLGFDQRWVNLVMMCVKIVSFLILINGTPKGPIIPTRCLRQGDSLSPYLFLMCTEGLICLLQKAVVQNKIQGIQICRGAPRINHLLFMDDCVLFFKTERSVNMKIQHVLNVFEQASGQHIKEARHQLFSTRMFQDYNKMSYFLCGVSNNFNNMTCIWDYHQWLGMRKIKSFQI